MFIVYLPAFARVAILLMLMVVGTSSSGPSLNLGDISQLKQAASLALKNLLSYYVPNSEGVYEEIQTPWHESSMIWNMQFDYAIWTGDTQFLSIATQALFNQSNGESRNFLEPTHPDVGQWNDDILWASQAAVAAAEYYGSNSRLPGSDGTWIDLAVQTFEQVATQTDDKCGGGIYWYRDRSDPKGTFKSLITHLEFISQGARNYMITKDENTLKQAQNILEWITYSGLANPHTGVLMDGVDTKNCKKLVSNQWSYNYGQLFGSLVWMQKATGDQKYLDMAIPYFDFSRRLFAGSYTRGVIAETCEHTPKKCGRDPQGFKAVYVRNLAYFYRATNNATMKLEIRNMIHTSIRAMLTRSCDRNWNCGGNWTRDTHPAKNIRSQHVSTALLVAAVGIHEEQKLEKYHPSQCEIKCRLQSRQGPPSHHLSG